MKAAGIRNGRLPWCTLGLVALAVAVSFAPGAADLLQYDRLAVRGGEIGRLLTGQWVHWTPRMAIFDLGAVLILGACLEWRSRSLLLWGMLAGALTTGLGIHLMAPQITIYRGASGVATTLFVLLALQGLRAPGVPLARGAAALALVMVAAKIVWEANSDGALAAGSLPEGVSVVPMAHLLGGLAAMVVFFLACVVRAVGGDRATTEGWGSSVSGLRPG
jgi:rhomboid family GlyGly-CTERM serine protease